MTDPQELAVIRFKEFPGGHHGHPCVSGRRFRYLRNPVRPAPVFGVLVKHHRKNRREPVFYCKGIHPAKVPGKSHLEILEIFQDVVIEIPAHPDSHQQFVVSPSQERTDIGLAAHAVFKSPGQREGKASNDFDIYLNCKKTNFKKKLTNF